MTLRNVIVMLVLAVIAALAYVALRDADTGGAKLPATLPEFVKDEVSRVVVKAADKTIVLRRRTDRTDAWETEEGTAVVRADAVAADELLGTLMRQDVRNRFERARLTPGDLAGYGLDAPALSIEITTPRETKTVRYGKRTREATGIYVDTGEGSDVWVVGGGTAEQVASMAAAGVRSRRISDVRLYDVGGLEIVRGGVTAMSATRDPQQNWRLSPMKGFADPTEFEQYLARLVNSDVSWVEVGAQDLRKYGLDPPRAEVRLVPRKGGEPAVILVGGDAAPSEPGGKPGCFVMEQGRPNVAAAPARFRDSVDADLTTLRDRSFARVGIDVEQVSVKLGDLAYELQLEGKSWDVTKPDRSPADRTAVDAALEKLRSWKIVEFADAGVPAEYGIGDASDFVELTMRGGAKTRYILGREADATSRWARRRSAEGDGGVERVDSSVLGLLAKGYAQFRRKLVRDNSAFMGDLVSIEFEDGASDDVPASQTVVVSRDPAAGRGWEPSSTAGPGVVGSIDASGVAKVTSALTQIVAKEWEIWNPGRNDEMGFHPPKADTCSIGLTFSGASGNHPNGNRQILFIGKRRPSGGWYAKFGDDTGWAFILADEDVRALTTPMKK